jgi:hypothetical protein
MYLISLQGQGTSAWPSSSGAPREWTAGTKKPSSPIWSRACLPMRVITRIDTAT